MGHKHKPECGQQIGGYICTRKLGHRGRWHKDEIRRGTWITEPVSEAAAAIASWSSPSGWIAQQAVVGFLEDGDEPQPWELNGPSWRVEKGECVEAVRLLVNNLVTDCFCPDCAGRIRSILDRAGCVIPPEVPGGER